MTRPLQLEGMQFAELRVVGPADAQGRRGRYWFCECSCGKTTSVLGAKLVSGHTKSCGHLAHQGVPQTHGKTNTREYKIWAHIVQRCTNPKRVQYHRYGGRGIKICERWRNDFAAFFEDMGPAPFPDAQIDRKDNDGHYEPGNCRWVTPTENKRNRANAVRLTHGDLTLSLGEWSERLGVHIRALKTRYYRGWTPDEIISGKKSTAPPPRKTARWIEHDGQRKTLTEWASEIGVPMKKLHGQLSRGWSLSDAMSAARKKGECDEQEHAA